MRWIEIEYRCRCEVCVAAPNHEVLPCARIKLLTRTPVAYSSSVGSVTSCALLQCSVRATQFGCPSDGCNFDGASSVLTRSGRTLAEHVRQSFRPRYVRLRCQLCQSTIVKSQRGEPFLSKLDPVSSRPRPSCLSTLPTPLHLCYGLNISVSHARALDTFLFSLALMRWNRP